MTNRPNTSNDALLLEAIFKSAIDGIIVINARGIIEMVNQAAADLFRYPAEEMIGRNVNMIVPSPHHNNHDQYIKRYLQTGERKIIGIGREVEGKRKDGSLFPLRLSISELRIGSDRKFTGIIHDLSEQKEAQKALEKEKEKAQMYFDLASTFNFILDRDGHIVQANQAALDFVGLEGSEIIGKLWVNLVIPMPLPHPEINFTAMASGERPFISFFESQAQDHEGTQHFFAWYNNILYDAQGQTSGFILSGTDITRRRIMEMELEDRVEQRTEELANAVNKLLAINQKLEFEIQERRTAVDALQKKEIELRKAYEKEMELNQLKSRFVSMASHEFRTPLATIQSSADLIEVYEKGDQQPQRLKHIRRIRSAVSHLNNMLNDLLSLSRLEEGKIQTECVSFNLKGFCSSLMGEVDGLLKPGQSILHTQPIPDQVIQTDRKLLTNILLNLLSNAIKYSAEESTVHFDVQLAGNQLELIVRDSGIGIPREDQTHLFSRFFRARNVENIKGTGLGLHIVKHYVDLLEGKIGFQSEEGKGTTFRIQIPLRPATPEAESL
jgi:PAS domain S-box-containing protein